jgi:hypothetical protein
MKKRTATVDEGFRNTNLLAAAMLTDARLYLKAAHALEDEQSIRSPDFFFFATQSN